MNLSTKVVTTKTHTAIFSADEFKTAALNLAKKGVGVADDQVASSDVAIAADGTVTVQLVEIASAADEAKAADAPATTPAADAPAAPHLQFAR